MTDAQFYTSIAIPSVLIVISWILVALSWMQQDKRMSRIEATLGNLARDIRSELITLRDSIHRDMVPLHERMATVEAKQ